MKYPIALSLVLLSARTAWAVPSPIIKRQDQAVKCEGGVSFQIDPSRAAVVEFQTPSTTYTRRTWPTAPGPITTDTGISCIPTPVRALSLHSIRDSRCRLTGVSIRYPVTHPFNNREGVDLCNGSKGLIEFPIVAGGGAYTGGVTPGPDRVIYHTPEANVFEFCGTITHTGAPTRGAFVACERV